MRRVRAADPESAELADVAIAGLTVLEKVWREDEDCPPVAGFWRQVRIAVETRPVAELQTALNAARGLRDLRLRFPFLHEDLEEIATKIEKRAWERERERLGIPPKVETGTGLVNDCACHCGSRHPARQGICTGQEDEPVKVTLVPPLTIPMCGPCALEFIRAREATEGP